ncbi:polyprenyl synthetase family protein [Desulfomonile tiedjei]|uniref:Geranylgeranyl pyrophosphate synthase n=1 Tax=Desulfomonile tiedjei (strain ATCC 49306 / DSM 6799 / DCB-1) TaxID=706587 RepID=I4C3R2_DESTA|nr:farnesyl diphosphate synthase [Desulfomonile tiedjei]AFM24203.1 geranylgeranyl pyrophosphate synthase [Desulfomonile tiedjei DSM 6799]
MTAPNIKEYMEARRDLAEKALDAMLPPEDNEPAVLHQAMRYSVFAGGKRIRPVLAMAAAEVVGGSGKQVLPLAVALECIHTYSLIHDDLPAMDNDDLRRGKPTVHKVFGEAVAILAGDALLTYGLGVLSLPEVSRTYRAENLLAAIRELALAAGSTRLIAGQVMDILCEGKDVDKHMVEYIVRNKTGALIRASLVCGATLVDGELERIEVLGKFGDLLGMIFQIRDDLLDIEGDPVKMGKAVQKDGDRGKATLPRLLGAERTEEIMYSLIRNAEDTIRPLGETANPLVQITHYIGKRVS